MSRDPVTPDASDLSSAAGAAPRVSPKPAAFPAALAMAATLLLGGCSILGSSQSSPTTIYAPDVRITPDPSWPTVAWQLSITKPSASRVVDSPRISVRPTPNEVQVYKGATWSQPSTDLIETAVLRGFEDSGRIPGVGRSSTGLRADYKLVMDLRRYEADYNGQSVPAATIEVNVKLLHGSDQRIVASKTFVRDERSAGVDVAQVADAFDVSLEAITRDIVGWTLLNGENDARALKPAR